MLQTLERVPGKRARMLILATLCLVPTAYVARKFDPQHGFTPLLAFGSLHYGYYTTALPQVRALSPMVVDGDGSDGQFYTQVAIDPSLRDPNLVKALDAPEYRSRRILLPFLAWCLGFGRPAAILTVYALLNVLFWYLMLALLVRILQPTTVRDWLCVGAIVWTSGALVSIRRSFTDLPAATFLVLVGAMSLRLKPFALALAALTKETYAICSWCVLAEARKPKIRWWQATIQLCVMLGPVAIWMLYGHSRFHQIPYTREDYSWPMEGWLSAIAGRLGRNPVFNALAAASLLVQLVYLFIRRRPDSFLWRSGITFGVAAIFLSHEPFVSLNSSTRDLLPLTIAFNALLTNELKFFWTWFLVGNGGLVTNLVTTIAGIIHPGSSN